jgi:phosphinothricin acetyltransferase
MEERIQQYSSLGFYVFEKAGKIVGYAYASKHRDRAAYQWCCEVSVYVDERHHGLGIATLLYLRLMQTLKSKGYVHAFAGITLPNHKSVQFHKRLGFKSIGVYPKIGFKLGGWHDVEWMTLELASPPKNPVRFF